MAAGAADYAFFLNDPDRLVDWDLVELVIVTSREEVNCPICLYSPSAAYARGASDLRADFLLVRSPSVVMFFAMRVSCSIWHERSNRAAIAIVLYAKNIFGNLS